MTLRRAALLVLLLHPCLKVQLDHPPDLLNDAVDISSDFHEYRNSYFVADKLATFDPATATGAITWTRNQLAPSLAFSNMENRLTPFAGLTFPANEWLATE